MYIKTEGIVLKTVKYSEKDLIITIFTKKIGKISFYGKGLRTSKNKTASAVQLFSLNEFLLKKNGNNYTVSSIDPIKNYFDISKDIDKFFVGTYILKLISLVTYENQTNNRLFELLLNTLDILLDLDIKKLDFLIRAFEIQLMNYIGIKPNLNKCTNCDNKDLTNAKFSPSSGGVLCQKCVKTSFDSLSIDASNIKLIDFILKYRLEDILKAKVSSILLDELKIINTRHLADHLDGYNFKDMNLNNF
ncbi:DNA repair protein RecO [Peptostreptococcaceae bacterium AGR-M142]